MGQSRLLQLPSVSIKMYLDCKAGYRGMHISVTNLVRYTKVTVTHTMGTDLNIRICDVNVSSIYIIVGNTSHDAAFSLMKFAAMLEEI